MTLDEFLKDEHVRNQWVEYTTKSGALSVYVHKHITDKRVITIANVMTLYGYGSIRRLYTNTFANIPAIAESIINPDLDKMLEKWGWTTAYYDLAGIPTRTNPKFDQMFGTQHRSPSAAIMSKRVDSTI